MNTPAANRRRVSEIRAEYTGSSYVVHSEPKSERERKKAYRERYERENRERLREEARRFRRGTH